MGRLSEILLECLQTTKNSSFYRLNGVKPSDRCVYGSINGPDAFVTAKPLRLKLSLQILIGRSRLIARYAFKTHQNGASRIAI